MIDSSPIMPRQSACKGSELEVSVAVNPEGWYGLVIGDCWLTTAEALGLIRYLQEHQGPLNILEGVNVFRANEFLKARHRHPEEEQLLAIEWEMDFGKTDMAYIPRMEIGRFGLERAFTRQTGVCADRIRGDWMGTDYITRAEVDEMLGPGGEEHQHGEE